MGGSRQWGDAVEIGDLKLSNRIVFTALTRCRADQETSVPNDLLVKYYTQRAGAGLMFTEASAWSQRGHAYPGAGNIITKEQAQGWKKVVDAVH